ncbi:MAG: quinone-dependent dihydroorotate dehydrogenase [Verrucomicrobiota bacterium]
MDTLYEKLVRPTLFKMDPEDAHRRGVRALSLLGSTGPLVGALREWNRLKADKPVRCLGLEFPNAVGVAAGMDKDGECVRGFEALGYGHVEVGTVTPKAQPGNDRPRLFRYPEAHAIINRMGFNNAGAEALAKRLSKSCPKAKRKVVVGVNIGKGRTTPLDRAPDDYLECFRTLVHEADYFTVNVSSPNTANLRQLQEREHLEAILGAVQQENLARGEAKVPLLVKIAPDLTFRQIDTLLEVVMAAQCDGVIATNTTIARSGAFASVKEDGGLSGRPLAHRSTKLINYIYKSTEGRLPIIGVGGIEDAHTAGEKIDAGASLIQVYTSMIFRGPFIGRTLARALRARQRRWI